ncbi:MAG: methyltransferase domain-containing protein [Polyangiales bacterium]|nr:methyltransferase domain-containing protein [Sandaracinaceae bacterium]
MATAHHSTAEAALAVALLGCPACAGRLSSVAGEHETTCSSCGAEYPVVAGVPLLLADPVGYVAEHRAALLAALVEFTELDPLDVATVERWARRRGAVTQRLFDDDFTRDEEAGDQTPVASFSEAFDGFLKDAAVRTPLAELLRLHGRPLGRTVEVGCGAGASSAALAARSDGLVITDRSFRAVLLARDHARRDPHVVVAAVMDAEQLALRAAASETVVALHLVDVLSDPLAFLEGAHEALAPRGALLLSTPDPALGLQNGPPEILGQLAGEARFQIAGRADHVPWLRVHSARELQVFFVQVMALLRPR